MTANSKLTAPLICLEEIRNEAVFKLMQNRLSAGWTDRHIEDAFETVELRIRGSLPESLQSALRSKNDSLDVDRNGTNHALRSEEILRFEPVPKWDRDKNKNPETVFEKYLAKEVVNLKGWATQIPIWSGIRGPRSDTKCNIDIGYVTSENAFCLCELKIRPTNDPLYAILELMTYIFGYLFVRKLATFARTTVREEIRGRSRGLLEARSIEWCVIAPEDFYEKKIEGSGGVRLRPTELEQVRRVAQKRAEKMIEKLGLDRKS